MPTMPDSASGVSIDAVLAELLHPAGADAEDAAAVADVLAEQDDRGHLSAISSCSASRIAVTTFFSLKRSASPSKKTCAHRGLAASGSAASQAAAMRGVDLALDLEAECLRPDVVEDLLGPQVLAEHVDGVVVAGLLHLVARTVGLVVVVGGMGRNR